MSGHILENVLKDLARIEKLIVSNNGELKEEYRLTKDI